MKFKCIIIFSLVNLLNACNNQTELSKKVDNVMSNYKKIPINQFNHDYYRKNINQSIRYDLIDPSLINLIGYSGIIILNKYKKNEFDSLDKLFNEKSFFKASLKDRNKYLMLTKSRRNFNKFPIPNIEDENNRIIDEISIDSSYILGFNYMQGNYLNDEFFIKNRKNVKLVQFLKENENGFSSGAIVDKKNNKILYWILVW